MENSIPEFNEKYKLEFSSRYYLYAFSYSFSSKYIIFQLIASFLPERCNNSSNTFQAALAQKTTTIKNKKTSMSYISLLQADENETVSANSPHEVAAANSQGDRTAAGN